MRFLENILNRIWRTYGFFDTVISCIYEEVLWKNDNSNVCRSKSKYAGEKKNPNDIQLISKIISHKLNNVCA